MKITLLASGLLLALSGCGGSSDSPQQTIPDNTPDNTSAVLSGDLSASINVGQASVSGTIAVTDPDSGEAALNAQTEVAGTYGAFSVNQDGAWTYSLNASNEALVALPEGATVTDSLTVSSVDTTTGSLLITITGVNDPAVIGSGEGVNQASIINTRSTAVTGALTISDPDTGEAAFSSIDALAVSYGAFSLTSAGTWTYELDLDNSTVNALQSESDILLENIAVSSIDGTSLDVIIRITGVSSPVQSTNLVKGSIGENDTVPVVSCDQIVTSTSALEDAASFNMTPGQTLCLASGTYSGLDLTFGGSGTQDLPITIAAEVPGSVTISGEVFIGMTGEYAVLQGFIFKDGTLDNSILQTRANSNTPCNHCRITENAFIDMDEGVEDSTKWIQVYGSENRFDHNWFSGKTTRGALFVIERGNEPGTVDRTQIDHNYFGDRPPKDGLAYADGSDNEYEGIRVGSSSSHTSDSFAVIEHNFFEGIDGEAEVISIKAGNVTVRHNTVRNSRGSIVSRHGEFSDINNNYIIGDGNPYAGGIRVVDANHSITNNYIDGARYLSTNFNGGILISNSDGSTSNGYQDVENVFVAHNTIVDSVNSFNFDAGSRSTPPDNIYVINNIVENAIGAVVRNSEELPTTYVFSNNIVHGNSLSDDTSVNAITGFAFEPIGLSRDAQGIARPSTTNTGLSATTSADTGTFDLPSNDMDGQIRNSDTLVGADDIVDTNPSQNDLRGVLNKALVGPISYDAPSSEPRVQVLALNNAGFDSGDLTAWLANNAVIVNGDDAFSRSNSAVVSGADGEIAQQVAVEPNTNYTFSAFVKGVGVLGVSAGEQTYTADNDSSSYSFTSVSFNSGDNQTVRVFATVDGVVETSVNIVNADFDNDQDNWVVNEGDGIGQVQDSSNSSSSTDGSIKFVYNDGDSGVPYDPYIAQTVTVEANTDYTLGMFNLLKSADAQDATVLFGVHTGAAVEGGVFDASDIVASKQSVYADLSEADEAEDSFRPDKITFNSGANTQLTIFAQYQSTQGDDIRIDEFSLVSTGAPGSDVSASFDDFRLVSHPDLP